MRRTAGVAARHLWDRAVHVSSRADALRALRLRFVETSLDTASPTEIHLAAELRRLRQAMSDALGTVSSCSRCAIGHPVPHGRWSGGHCCGCDTQQVFTDAEVAALQLGGTRPSRLKAPSGDHAGCVFRGAAGCRLPVVDRPTICVRYVCRELEDELRGRDDWKRIQRAGSELRALLAQFCAERERRRSALDPW